MAYESQTRTIFLEGGEEQLYLDTLVWGLDVNVKSLANSKHLDAEGQTRTLYSLRHTYATFEMLRGEVDIHTLSKQMGNSAAMIERHYSKLTATMAAERLA